MGWELPADNLQRDILQHQQATEAAGSREAGGTVPETFDERQVPVGAEAGSGLTPCRLSTPWGVHGLPCFSRLGGRDSEASRSAAVAQASAEAVAAATAAAAAIVGQEQPCTVKLKLWHYDASKPRQQLTIPRLIIPHTVLCSEMGVHFSPCGRWVDGAFLCRCLFVSRMGPR